MFGSLGVPELIFIFALALLIFGPRKLPEIGRTIGRGLSEFRKASTELKRSINAEMIEEELRQSDPRRMMDEPAPASKPAKSGDSDTDRESAAEPPADASPAGSVARSSSGTSADDGDSTEPPAAAPPAGSVPRSGASSDGASSDVSSAATPADSEAS